MNMLKIIGSVFQGLGLIFFLFFSVGAGALGLYELFTGQSSSETEVGNLLTVLSFFGVVPLSFLIFGSVLIKKATINSYFPNKIFAILAKLVIVPICIGLSASLAMIMIPFFAYRYYQYRNGIETGTTRFVKWIIDGWQITLLLYVVLVLSVLFLMFKHETLLNQYTNGISVSENTDTVAETKTTKKKEGFAN